MTTTLPKSRGILFSAPMVQALLSGRKTQTRRIIKPQPFADAHGFLDGPWCRKRVGDLILPRITDLWSECPYGQHGDLLYVKETHARCTKSGGHWIYRADGDGFSTCHVSGYRWRSSIHMSRAASRIWLRITNVRVQRVQDISEEDAMAEGVAIDIGHGYRTAGSDHVHRSAAGCFNTLWNHLNGAENFEKANPWVWALTFERIDKPEGI